MPLHNMQANTETQDGKLFTVLNREQWDKLQIAVDKFTQAMTHWQPMEAASSDQTEPDFRTVDDRTQALTHLQTTVVDSNTTSLMGEEMVDALTDSGVTEGTQLFYGQDDRYRNPLWRSLRPTRAFTLTEHCETRLHEQTQQWLDTATESVTTDPKTMQTQLFRGAVVDTPPGGIQSKLANVPGLDMMSMGRNTKAHQETKKALNEQGTEVTRKLAQTSLEQTKKQKGMRVVKSSPEDSDEARSHGYARKRSDTPSSAPAVVERPRQTGQGRGRLQPGGRQWTGGQERREIRTCWGCSLEGQPWELSN
ncbi:hypothetical protein DPEC_G00187310 [Dallia pectoralis]|uniref:Uncharacterized protein n=1 Tax=Dallia pectoralis TaxID=75939 RepID=A0ACC2GBG0_DALPE|nr:hypothetical protein DPEC_G00187310 [Dallia pectoralis]